MLPQFALLVLGSWLILFTSGCVSSYKHVLISVVDEDTGAPIAGAKVRTMYWSTSKFSLAAQSPDEAITDHLGRAILRGNFLPQEPAIGRTTSKQGFEPGYEVELDNAQYSIHMGVLQTDYTPSRAFTRAKNEIPTEPDLIFHVSSRAAQSAKALAYQQQQARDKEQAQSWFVNAPTFWPESEKSPYEQAKEGAAGQILLGLRWKSGSIDKLGSDDDIIEIERLVLTDMQHPKGEIGEFRWLSPTLVMLSCSWYSGPLAAAGYTYVTEKKNGRWIVLVRYLDWIS